MTLSEELKAELKADEARARKLVAFQARCPHPPGRHWQDQYRYKCHMRRDFKNAHTWHCDACFAQLPFGESLNPYVEQLAFDFLLGEFDHHVGGFPSVAFHDGYRNYDERVDAWVQAAARVGGERAARDAADQLDDYAAGAFASELEKTGWQG